VASESWRPDLDELRRIHSGSSSLIKETPVFSLGELSRRCGGKIAVKAECMQRTGSFKLRGTTAKLAAIDPDACPGVVTGSAGNHGQALAYAARARGIPCTIFMPEDAPVSKVDAVTAFGAEVRTRPGSVDDCVDAARAFAEEEGVLFVHPFDDLDVIKGQAGVGIELAEQVPELTRVIVPVGGGGLISGLAAALSELRPEVEIFGVQADTPIADGIAIKRPGTLTLPLVERWVEGLVTVEDDAIAAAMVLLIERGKLVTEGAGAAAVAALMTGAVAPAPEGTTVAVLSGGNVDPSVLAAIINRHQTGIGRRARIFSRISDQPGGLVDFLQNVAAAGGNVLDVTHVRDGVSLHVNETGVEVLVESRSEGDRESLIERLRSHGYEVEELG
jgi:threonine dehydratase